MYLLAKTLCIGLRLMFGMAKKVVAAFRRSWKGDRYKMRGYIHIHSTQSTPPHNRFHANTYADLSNITVNMVNLCTEKRVHITGPWAYNTP